MFSTRNILLKSEFTRIYHIKKTRMVLTVTDTLLHNVRETTKRKYFYIHVNNVTYVGRTVFQTIIINYYYRNGLEKIMLEKTKLN